MSITIPQEGPSLARRTLGSFAPHPATIGKIAGIAAPRLKLAGGGIADAENISQNMFQPINGVNGIPNADVDFITSPNIQGGKGPPAPPSSKPNQQPSPTQQLAEGTQAANAGIGLYKATGSGLLSGTGNNPSLYGSLQSGFGGNGFGGVLSGPNAQTALADGTNGFAPGVSLDTLGSGASTAIPESAVGVGQAIDASAAELPAAADAAASAATAAGSTAGTAGFFDMLAALFAKGGSVPKRDDGGPIENALQRSEASATYHPGGLLNSAGPGRTDTINTNVPTGAYVVPADVVSGTGEGNTLAGSAIIDRIFSSQPHGIQARPIREGRGVKIPNPPSSEPRQPPTGVQRGATIDTAAINDAGAYAKGGKVNDEKAPVVLAGGEMVIHPNKIIGKFGSLKRGHRILDHWVVLERRKIAKEMLKLPNPVGSKVRI